MTSSAGTAHSRVWPGTRGSGMPRRRPPVILACAVLLQVVAPARAAAQTVLHAQVGYARGLRSEPSDGGLALFFGATRPLARSFQWGLEAGFAHLGTRTWPADTTTFRFGSEQHTSVFVAGPVFVWHAVPSTARTSLRAGFAYYRVSASRRLSSPQSIGSTAFNREGVGPNIAANVLRIGPARAASFAVTLRFDAPLTHRLNDPPEPLSSPGAAGPSGWAFYPFVTLSGTLFFRFEG